MNNKSEGRTPYRIGEPCPRCHNIMIQTYEPYQVQCTKCGFDWDNWTGKSIHGIQPDDAIFIGNSVHCPVCGEFDEGEPISRRDFRGQVYEQDWKETHRCPKCGTLYEHNDGNY